MEELVRIMEHSCEGKTAARCSSVLPGNSSILESPNTKRQRRYGDFEFVRDSVTSILKSLIALSLIRKFPSIGASDIMCLFGAVSTLMLAGVPFRCVTVVFMAVHSIRDPDLVRRLFDAIVEAAPVRASVCLLQINDLLAEEPFLSQKTGAPYWLEFAALHKGSQYVRTSWLIAEKEQEYLAAAHALALHASGKNAAEDVMSALQKLPGMASYGFHVLRAFQVVMVATRTVLCNVNMPYCRFK